jgi:hypothetical protein
MKKKLMLVSLVTVMLLPAMAFGATFQGTVQGFLCVTSGITCPVGMEEVAAAAENVFVLYEGKDKWYFFSNVDQKLLARGINRTIKVEGTLDEKSKSIKADVIHLQQPDGKWKKVWAADPNDDIYADYFGAHPLKGGQ